MKSLVQFIKESKFDRDMQIIDTDIILESLKDPKLLKLAKYLKQFANKNKNIDSSFANLFGRYNVEWDKITESDWETIEDYERARKAVRKIITNGKNSIATLALITDENGKDIRYLISPITFIDFKHGTNKYNYETGQYQYKEAPQVDHLMKQYEMLNYITDGCITYILDASKYQTTGSKRMERYDSKNGMVLQGDEYYYREVARKNIERYKKIIAQNKAERVAQKDNLSQEVKEVLNKILELNMKMVSNPTKYADCQYDLGKLSYEAYNGLSKAKSGNSLLYYYNEYVSYLVKNASGKAAYGFEYEGGDKKIVELQRKIKEIKEVIAEIEAKMED